MGQGFSASVEAGKDGKAAPCAAQPSRLFGLDTLNALLAEQIETVETAAPRDGPSTIEDWLVSEGLQDVAADDLDSAPPTPRDGPATIEAWLVSEGLEAVAADELVEELTDLAASVASLAASVSPDREAALRDWEVEEADTPNLWRPEPLIDTAAARDEARRRQLLGTVDRLTAMPAVGKTSRSA